LNLRQVARGEPDAQAAAKRMADQNHAASDAIEQVLLHEIGVLNRVPIGRRRRGFAKTRQIDQVNAVRVLEQSADAAQAFTAAAPPVQEHHVPGDCVSEHFVNQLSAVMLEAFDVVLQRGQFTTPFARARRRDAAS
jgi:hypothetical protein